MAQVLTLVRLCLFDRQIYQFVTIYKFLNFTKNAKNFLFSVLTPPPATILKPIPPLTPLS